MNRQQSDGEQEKNERRGDHNGDRGLHRRASKHGEPPNADGVS